MRNAIFAALTFLLTAQASAGVWMIGDNDGYGMGLPDNANHSFNGFSANYDGRSLDEKLATNGAQFTDTYSTTHTGYGPQPGNTATFTFNGLGSGWTEGSMWFDMADFQASTFGAVSVTYNGIAQNWAFNDGFPTTKVRFFNLESAVLDSINATGQLVVSIARNGSADFYGFDYALLSDQFGEKGIAEVTEPGPLGLLVLGVGALWLTRRRQAQSSAMPMTCA
jgi:MYXO-CTERM domain-containing protein